MSSCWRVALIAVSAYSSPIQDGSSDFNTCKNSGLCHPNPEVDGSDDAALLQGDRGSQPERRERGRFPSGRFPDRIPDRDPDRIPDRDPDGNDDDDAVPDDEEHENEIIDRFRESLENVDFVVQEGLFGFYDMDYCKNSDTCYALNPLTPYGVAWIPHHPRGESATEVPYENACHQHNFCLNRSSGDPWGLSWRLAPGEVLVFIGKSPPEATYWSFTPYLYNRYLTKRYMPPLGVDVTGLCPRAGNRCEIFSGVNDPLNHLTYSFNSGGSFENDIAVVMAWDDRSGHRAAGVLESAGHKNVMILEVPGSIGKLGVTTGMEDEWTILLRVAGIKDKAKAEAFYDRNNPPYRAFRVTPPESFSVSDSLYPSFADSLRPRETGKLEAGEDATTEMLMDALERLQEEVIKSEKARYADKCVGLRCRLKVNKAHFYSFVQDSGYQCLSEDAPTKCQGDCRDTVYGKSSFDLRDDDNLLTEEVGDSIFAMGVNHRMTKQSLYSSVTPYAVPKMSSVSHGIKDDMYEGTAKVYLGEDDPAVKYLWAVKFARSCDEDEKAYCVELHAEDVDPLVAPLSLDSQIIFLERMYINPETNSGPAVKETILGKLIHFKPRGNRNPKDFDSGLYDLKEFLPLTFETKTNVAFG